MKDLSILDRITVVAIAVTLLFIGGVTVLISTNQPAYTWVRESAVSESLHCPDGTSPGVVLFQQGLNEQPGDYYSAYDIGDDSFSTWASETRAKLELEKSCKDHTMASK